MSSVRYRIREKRRERGLRQRDVAEALKIQPHNVSCWERGEYRPSGEHLAELCRVLGCLPSDLIVLEVSMGK